MADEQELIAEREKKAAEIRGLGGNPYANGFIPTHSTAEIRAKFAGATAPPPENGDGGGKGAPPAMLSDDDFAVAGRVISYRGFGKMAFAKLLDRTGEIQIQVRKD